MKLKWCSFFLALVAVIGFIQPTSAQLTSQITGTVTDTTDAVIPGVQITVTKVDTGVKWNALTNTSGYYIVPFLQPGAYDIAFDKEGFRLVQRAGVRLDVAQTATLDIAMQLGTLAETIEVTAEAPLLDTGTNAIGQVIDHERVVNLPTNGRNTSSFLRLAPGVRAPQGMTEPVTDQYSSVFVSINGSRPNQNSFYIDGGNNTQSSFSGPVITPSPDVVEEFKVQTSNFSAEYTNAAGGVINLVTKSGTNRFHGTAYEFLRNDKLMANDFFRNGQGLERPVFRYNQFGATIGGPVVKDRTFFFYGYQGLRWQQPQPQLVSLPSPLQLEGDFSQTFNPAGQVISIYNPSTTRADPASPGRFVRDPFVNNRIPGASINPVSRNAAKFYPQGNIAGDPVTGLNNFSFADPGSVPVDDHVVRVDHQLSNSSKLFGRISSDRTKTLDSDIYGDDNPASPGGQKRRFTAWAGTLNGTFVLNPTLFAEASSSFNRYTMRRTFNSIGFDPVNLGMPQSLSDASPLIVFPIFNITGMNNLGGYNFPVHGYDRFEEKINFTKITGKHTLKFGGLFGVLRLNVVNINNASGSYQFAPSFTQGPDPLRASQSAGLGFATFLLGTPTGGFHSTVPVGMNITSKYSGFYLQDDFKVTSRLTLNLGVRYDYETPRTERYDHQVNFDFNSVSDVNGLSVPGGLQYPGANGLARGNRVKDVNNFAPRFGFAYNLNTDTVIRGGYGVFFAQNTGGGFNSQAAPNVGFSCDTDIVSTLDGVTPNVTLSNPFPNGYCSAPGSSGGLLSALGLSVDFIDRNNATPYSQQWNFNIQRLLPGQMTAEIGYSGNRGIRLMGDLISNQIPLEAMALGSGLLTQVPNPYSGIVTSGPMAAARVTRNRLLRPFPQYNNAISRGATYGASTYHAMYLTARRRFSRGVSFSASYTWSKLIDDVPPTTTGFPGEAFSSGALQNFNDRRAERALATFDTPHNFSLAGLWELPFGAGKRFLSQGGILDKIVGGWQVNGIVSVLSGAPLQLTGGNATQSFGGLERPDWTGIDASLNGPIGDRLGQYFDAAQFPKNSPFTFGNAPRVMPNLRAPGIRDLDFSLFKNFVVTEDVRVQLRGEFFNVLNHPLFGLPVTNINATNRGQITSQANSPRNVQLAIKLIF